MSGGPQGVGGLLPEHGRRGRQDRRELGRRAGLLGCGRRRQLLVKRPGADGTGTSPTLRCPPDAPPPKQNPCARSRGSDQPSGLLPTWNPVTSSWMGPFIMELVNSRIVHRSNALAAEKYGKDFKCGRAGAPRSRRPRGVLAWAAWSGGGFLGGRAARSRPRVPQRGERTGGDTRAPARGSGTPHTARSVTRLTARAPRFLATRPPADREAISASLPVASLTAAAMFIGGAVMAFSPTRALATRWAGRGAVGPAARGAVAAGLRRTAEASCWSLPDCLAHLHLTVRTTPAPDPQILRAARSPSPGRARAGAFAASGMSGARVVWGFTPFLCAVRGARRAFPVAQAAPAPPPPFWWAWPSD